MCIRDSLTFATDYCGVKSGRDTDKFKDMKLSLIHIYLKDVLEGKDFSVNIISKSGTTTEPAIAFRVFKKMLIEKYGKEEANKRIYATTDLSLIHIWRIC